MYGFTRIRIRLFLGTIFILVQESRQGEHERKLLNDLFVHSNYNVLERPVKNDSEPVEVFFGIILQQIIDVDEKNQIIRTNIWLQMKWHDTNMVWDPLKYGNITSIRVPPTKLWTPDILMYNSADEAFDGTYPANIVLHSTGNCLWVPPGMFKSTCPINIRWFPFDDQQCDMKFGSWTHHGRYLNLKMDTPDAGDISNFIRNGEWILLGLPGVRSELQYECCPEIYIDITFTIKIRRRTLYYGFNIVLPCVLISSMALLLFVLPPDAGEKISLGVTILLSLMVFLLLVAETMPPTSDAVPLIGLYFSCIMVMCSLSIGLTVLVLNLHYRGPDTHVMPNWVKTGVCGWLAWTLRMNRPGEVVPKKYTTQHTKLDQYRLKDRSSKSLLANVLDMEDDIRCETNSNGRVPIKPEDSFHPLHGVRGELVSILKELRKITRRQKTKEDVSDIRGDWKYAAMVIDRLCLWICVTFTTVSTLAILLSAPHLSA